MSLVQSDNLWTRIEGAREFLSKVKQNCDLQGRKPTMADMTLLDVTTAMLELKADMAGVLRQQEKMLKMLTKLASEKD